MTMIAKEKKEIRPGVMVVALLCASLCGCRNIQGKPDIVNIGETQMETNSALETNVQEPYAVKTVLKESSAVDPYTGTGIYSRHTELSAPESAPETLKQAIAECNRRAEEAVQRRMLSGKPLKIYQNRNKYLKNHSQEIHL